MKVVAKTREELMAMYPTRRGIACGDRCALCGARQPNSHFTNSNGERYWEGWEIKDQNGHHLRYLPDMPERLCPC